MICQRLVANDDSIHVLTMEPELERKLMQGVKTNDSSSSLILEPGLTDNLLSSVASSAEKMMASNYLPVILCSPGIRRHLKNLLNRILPHATVLSLSEVPSSAQIRAFGVINLEGAR